MEDEQKKLEILIANSRDKTLECLANGELKGNFQIPLHTGLDYEDFHLIFSGAKKNLSENPRLLVMGSCDGISLIYANQEKYLTYGIEKESSLVQISRNNIALAALNKITSQNIRAPMIVEGDMLNPITYYDNNMSLYDFDVFLVHQLEKIFVKTMELLRPRITSSARILIPSHRKYSKNIEQVSEKNNMTIEQKYTTKNGGYFYQLKLS